MATKVAIPTGADEVRTITSAEAERLPGLLGMIAARTLTARGWYGYTDAGRKVLLVLAK